MAEENQADLGQPVTDGGLRQQSQSPSMRKRILVSAGAAHRGWTAAQRHVLGAQPCSVSFYVGRWWLPLGFR